MSNVWGNPRGSNDDKNMTDYKDRKPVHIPKVLTEGNAEYRQPAVQESSTIAGTTQQTQEQINEAKLSNFEPRTEVDKNGVTRVVGYKLRD